LCHREKTPRLEKKKRKAPEGGLRWTSVAPITGSGNAIDEKTYEKSATKQQRHGEGEARSPIPGSSIRVFFTSEGTNITRGMGCKGEGKLWRNIRRLHKGRGARRCLFRKRGGAINLDGRLRINQLRSKERDEGSRWG